MKNKMMKRMLAGVLVLAVAVVGFINMPKKAEAENAGVVKYQKVANVDFVSCIDAKKAPACTLNDTENVGYLFAGWYEDEALTKPIAAKGGITADVYAKFVPSYLTGIACQVDTNEGDTRNLRVVSLVHSEYYSAVGFNVYGRYDADGDGTNETEWLMYSYDSSNKAETNKLFRGLYADKDGEQIKRMPQDVFGADAEGFYFTTVSITGIGVQHNPNTDKDVDFRDATMAVKPYWITLDGTYVEGMGEFNRVNDYKEKIVNVSVNIKNATIADTFGTDPIACGRNVTLLKWISFENVSSYTVKLAMKEDMSDAITYKSDDCTLELMNLLVDTDYYWTVAAGEFVSDVQTFHTQDTIRSITIDGVANARDGGGWDTIDGKRVKQGMFYRGAKIDDITEAGKDVMLNQLGIKTDLDLRNPGEEASGSSPLGTSINYINVGGPYYWDDTRGINAAAYQDALVTEIKTFANPDNYPIYVHCSIGRDRTGTICFLINSLLGVGEQDLFMDYEFSTLSLTRTEYSSAEWLTGVFKTMYDNVKAYAPDGTMAEATEAFMLSIGITQGEIDSIREILLEQ